MNLAKRSMGAVLCCLALTTAACSTSGKATEQTSGGDGTTTTTVDGGGATTTAPKSTTTDAPRSTTTAVPKAPTVEVTESGFSTYEGYDEELATAGAVLENTGKSDAVFFDVVFTFVDADGKPVATDTAYVYNLAAGETGYAAVTYVELGGKVKSVEVEALAEADSYSEGTSLDVEVGSVDKEEYGDGSLVTGTATNDTEAVLDGYQVACVLRVKKKIVGGAEGYLDKIGVGKSIAWEARGSVPADAAECSASSVA